MLELWVEDCSYVKLSLMLLVANFANPKSFKIPEHLMATLAYGYSSESTLLSNKFQYMTGFRWYSKIFASLFFG